MIEGEGMVLGWWWESGGTKRTKGGGGCVCSLHDLGDLAFFFLDKDIAGLGLEGRCDLAVMEMGGYIHGEDGG